MRKQRRAAASRVTAAASRASARKSKTKAVKRRMAAPARTTTVAKTVLGANAKPAIAVASSKTAVAVGSSKTAITVASNKATTVGSKTTVGVREPAQPPPPPRKPAFYEALAIYETGVRALQRHDFQIGADSFRSVIQRYPGERELAERATLFLQVCERETARRSAPPESTSDAVGAATLALHAGDAEGALARLGKVLERAPDSDHAHYIMAVALTEKGNSGLALRHLRQAISLNPDNRSNAVKDPDLDALRELSAFQELVDDGVVAPGRRLRSRR
jgi:tetratricopeptide (TPR) repeat protein